jgi:hypothetical protein
VSHLKRTVIELLALLLLIGAFGINMYCRGRRAGRAIQNGTDRRENVERAKDRQDFEAIDREWER